MKKIDIGMLLLLVFVSACGSVSKTQFKETDSGMKSIEIKNMQASINYFHDYWFHKPVKKYTLHWNEPLMKSIGKGKIVYAAHTTLDPYCSTLGVLYKNAKLDDVVRNVFYDLKSKFHGKNLAESKDYVGANVFTKLKYELPDPVLKVQYKYVEYYCSNEQTTLRIVFWTMETQTEEWFDNEVKGVITSLKID